MYGKFHDIIFSLILWFGSLEWFCINYPVQWFLPWIIYPISVCLYWTRWSKLFMFWCTVLLMKNRLLLKFGHFWATNIFQHIWKKKSRIFGKIFRRFGMPRRMPAWWWQISEAENNFQKILDILTNFVIFQWSTPLLLEVISLILAFQL